MYLGSRKIRSAGRTSGSIEITLPVKLGALQGVSCNVEIRDGLRPEIVLKPNLSDIQTLMRSLWEKLAIGMYTIGDIGEFRLSDFSVSVFPMQYWKDRPPLSYVDAIHAHEELNGEKNNDEKNYGEKNMGRGGLGRLIAFMVVRAGKVLGLQNDFALAFGDSISFLISGYSNNLGAEFERGMAYRLFGEDTVQMVQQANILDDAIWQKIAVPVQKVFDQFFLWQGALEIYEEDRNNWYRALSFEMESPSSKVL